jgi:sugar lactone lactonase YvrE
LDLDSGQLTTVAGNGVMGYSGDGGPATAARLNEPYEIRFDPQGNMYLVEMKNHVVRRVDARSRTISTIAGTGQPGFSGDGGPARAAQLNNPHSIALDGGSGLYVADIGNHRIRRVDLQAGTIESIAGNGQRQLPIDGQPARGHPMLGPRALFVEQQSLWIALREGHSIWRMDLDDGRLHHVAGTGRRGYSGDGAKANEATFDGPKGIAIGPHGHIYVADTENHAIRRIDRPTGIIATIAGGGPERRGGDGDGQLATAARLDRPHGICVGREGAVYVGDTLNHRVRRVRPNAGNNQPSSSPSPSTSPSSSPSDSCSPGTMIGMIP